jgi:hypothetical protein
VTACHLRAQRPILSGPIFYVIEMKDLFFANPLQHIRSYISKGTPTRRLPLAGSPSRATTGIVRIYRRISRLRHQSTALTCRRIDSPRSLTYASVIAISARLKAVTHPGSPSVLHSFPAQNPRFGHPAHRPQPVAPVRFPSPHLPRLKGIYRVACSAKLDIHRRKRLRRIHLRGIARQKSAQPENPILRNPPAMNLGASRLEFRKTAQQLT